MTLDEQLAKMRATMAKEIPAEIREQMHIENETLRASGMLERAIKPGDPLPPFEMPNYTGETISSEALLAEGPLVISFFRGHWCPYCAVELYALREIVDDLKALGANLVAMTPTLPEFNKAQIEKRRLNFPLLTDRGNDYAEGIGIRFVLAEVLQKAYANVGGIDLPTINGDPSWTLPIPTRLVIDPGGIVRAVDMDPDYTYRPEPSKSVADVRALVDAAAA
ncbi:MAG: peroxiredoxin-like family protein [Bauldia litoralis]